MIDRVDQPGLEYYSPAKRIGELLAREFQRDPHFYFFSPDETTSNRLDKIFEVKNEPGDFSPMIKICRKLQTVGL